MRHHYTRYILLICLPLVSAGCATLDTTLGNVGNVLDTTTDVLSGDFRSLGNATPVTLNQIHADWKKNELNAQKKYAQTTLNIPGIVTRVSKASVITNTNRSQQVFVVYFRDPSNNSCNGIAHTRDDLAPQEALLSRLNAGDRIRITAVIDNHIGSVVTSTSCTFSFSKAKIMTEPKS